MIYSNYQIFWDSRSNNSTDYYQYENMEKDEKCKFFAFLISALIIYSSPMKIEHGIVTSGKRLKIEKERGEFHKPENCKTSPWTFSINSEYRSFIPHHPFERKKYK